MPLHEKILHLRTELGLSQMEIAERLGVSRQSVSKWETGQSVPDLDKLIKLADLFGISMDELVREEERPQPPKPEPQVVYIKEKQGLTGVQTAGICVEAAGLVLALFGLMGAGELLLLIGAALVILGLPLLLAKKHPWIIFGWLLVGMSLLIFNPYTSMTPWGLVGGLRLIWVCITYPEAWYVSTQLAILISVSRGLLAIWLVWRTWVAYRTGRTKKGQQ